MDTIDYFLHCGGRAKTRPIFPTNESEYDCIMYGKRFALISVTDKRDLPLLVEPLVDKGFGILSTGGTAKHLRDAGFPVTDVSEFTEFPEMFNGRLKTLHPKVFGPILARAIEEDEMGLKTLDWPRIDVVIVNLYDFEAKARELATEGARLPRPEQVDQLIEEIDIGGPSLLRAGAKNWRRVTVAHSVETYKKIADQIKVTGSTDLRLRFRLARQVFEKTSTYDRMIFENLEKYDLDI